MRPNVRCLPKLLILALIPASGAIQAADISGLWYGVAEYTGGNSDFDHQTVLSIAATPQTGISKVTYIYPALGVTCRSDLSFTGVQTQGSAPNIQRIWTFNDETNSAQCTDGTVRITTLFHAYGQPSVIQFEWINPVGNVDNVGIFQRTDISLP
jgi:hypothetical protein